MVNEQGGVAGHKIDFISLDDNYSPPKTVEQIRRLVEEEKVAFTFATLGTPTNSAIVRYMNQKKVPQLFVSTGADKWGDTSIRRGRSAGSQAIGPKHRSTRSTSCSRSLMRRSASCIRTTTSGRIIRPA